MVEVGLHVHVLCVLLLVCRRFCLSSCLLPLGLVGGIFILSFLFLFFLFHLPGRVAPAATPHLTQPQTAPSLNAGKKNVLSSLGCARTHLLLLRLAQAPALPMPGAWARGAGCGRQHLRRVQQRVRWSEALAAAGKTQHMLRVALDSGFSEKGFGLARHSHRQFLCECLRLRL